MPHGLFKNFVFSVSGDGRLATVRVDIPQTDANILGSDGTAAWAPTSLSDAPFSIHSPTQMEWDYPTPTTAEVSQSNAAQVEDSEELRKKRVKAKGRSPTIMTGVTGVTGGLTLGKPSLLGRA